jgi:hypothetical protein
MLKQLESRLEAEVRDEAAAMFESEWSGIWDVINGFWDSFHSAYEGDKKGRLCTLFGEVNKNLKAVQVYIRSGEKPEGYDGGYTLASEENSVVFVGDWYLQRASDKILAQLLNREEPKAEPSVENGPRYFVTVKQTIPGVHETGASHYPGAPAGVHRWRWTELKRRFPFLRKIHWHSFRDQDIVLHSMKWTVEDMEYEVRLEEAIANG